MLGAAQALREIVQLRRERERLVALGAQRMEIPAGIDRFEELGRASRGCGERGDTLVILAHGVGREAVNVGERAAECQADLELERAPRVSGQARHQGQGRLEVRDRLAAGEALPGAYA